MSNNLPSGEVFMFHGMIFTFLTMALFKPPPKKNQSLANFTAISKTYQFAVKKVLIPEQLFCICTLVKWNIMEGPDVLGGNPVNIIGDVHGGAVHSPN